VFAKLNENAALSRIPIKRALRILLGKDLLTVIQERRPCQSFGTTYGSWTICTEELTRDSVIYSGGVGHDVSFDVEVIQQFGAQVFAFDPTPKAVDWVKTQLLPPQFHFYPLGISDHDGTEEFVAPENSAHVSYSSAQKIQSAKEIVKCEVRRIKTLMSQFGHNRIDILKLDVEGSEFMILDDVLNGYLDIGQICIEFHHRLPGIGVSKTKDALEKLYGAGYRIFFISRSGDEYSFIKT
jgi:FkbM family methyltransferase